jgi:hypothetical protein
MRHDPDDGVPLQSWAVFTIPLGSVLVESVCMARWGRSLIGLLSGNEYGNISRATAHGALMELHIWAASAMWILGAVQVCVKRLRRPPHAWVHRFCGQVFVGLWLFIVGPTSYYLSAVIKAPSSVVGTLSSVLLMDYATLSYFFFLRALTVARRRKSGPRSLALHGQLMRLGYLATMALLGQRQFILMLLALRGVISAAAPVLDGSGPLPISAPWLAAAARWVAGVALSNETLWCVSMTGAAGAAVALCDGPRTCWLGREFDHGIVERERDEAFGALGRWRWAWRSRWVLYALLRHAWAGVDAGGEYG